MIKINIVYAYMHTARMDVPSPGVAASVVWSRMEESDADIVVYFNGYSYDASVARRNPQACRMLYIYEPLVVYPRQFMRGFWEPFDWILTWCDTLAEQGGKFVKFPSLYYDFPFGAAHGVRGDRSFPPDWQAKRKAICQVAGNKHSLMPSELYSRRRAIACWFGKKGKMQLDTYGTPPMPVPNYKGRAADKLETMSAYRYALCLENDGHPLWSRGYITEKIFDCFHAFAVPVYLGASDVEKHIPAECFLDLRRFDDLTELDDDLSGMPDNEYASHLDAIERFLQSYDAPYKHSCLRLYEMALELSTSPIGEPRSRPFGFWQCASSREKACYVGMASAWPIYRAVSKPRYSGT